MKSIGLVWFVGIAQSRPLCDHEFGSLIGTTMSKLGEWHSSVLQYLGKEVCVTEFRSANLAPLMITVQWRQPGHQVVTSTIWPSFPLPALLHSGARTLLLEAVLVGPVFLYVYQFLLHGM